MGRLEYIRNRLKDRGSSVGKAMTFDRYLMLSPKERYPEIECLVDVVDKELSQATLNDGDSGDWRAEAFEVGARGSFQKFRTRERSRLIVGQREMLRKRRAVWKEERRELDFLRQKKDPSWR